MKQRLLFVAACISLIANWAALAQWVHTDTLLGYLINDDEIELDGSLTVLSYVEGCISWPKTTQDQQWSNRFLETMETCRQFRLEPAYLQLMDDIEETNSHTDRRAASETGPANPPEDGNPN